MFDPWREIAIVVAQKNAHTQPKNTIKENRPGAGFRGNIRTSNVPIQTSRLYGDSERIGRYLDVSADHHEVPATAN